MVLEWCVFLEALQDSVAGGLSRSSGISAGPVGAAAVLDGVSLRNVRSSLFQLRLSSSCEE